MKNIIKKALPLTVISFLSACTGSTMVVSDNSISLMAVTNMSSTEIYFSCKSCKGEIIYQFNVG